LNFYENLPNVGEQGPKSEISTNARLSSVKDWPSGQCFYPVSDEIPINVGVIFYRRKVGYDYY